MSAPVGRLAPSPTGALHVGHARTFLLAWWSVRSRGGRMLLRMEDLDRDRVQPGLADGVLRDLEWLGLDWDGEVVWQSERAALYDEALDRLRAAGRVYPCICTRREVALAASAPHASDGTRAYPGTCRGRFASEADARAAGRSAALRFVVPAEPVALVDAFVGEVAVDVAREAGDFPVTRRDGAAAYQLAVVVDDAEQGVSEVLRGDDLLSSAGRQALLQDALGLPRPTWCHVPLVLDADGERLAKRTGGTALGELRTSGVDPRVVVGWAARSAGVAGPERGLAPEFTAGFGLGNIPREPVRFAPRGYDGSRAT